ncbi:ATP-binding protein [Ktedonobacter robiniae]|nr:ATP-binding protein [Ktedonobacter robiniae]
MSGRKRQMKIAFIGTSCVGKTTLLERYRETFKNDPGVAFVAEAARMFFANHATSDRFSVETQGKIQLLALRNEQEAYATGAHLLFCDRSVLDAVVYVRACGDKLGANKLFERVQTWSSTYSKLLLLDPVGVDYVIDGIRQEDLDTRQQFHDAFIHFFEETSLPYELLNGTFQERCRRIDEILKAFQEEEKIKLPG